MKSNKKLFILPLVIALILTASATVSPLGGVSKALATTTLGNALNGDLLSGKTATTDAGPITGTITNRSGSFNQTTWSNGDANAGVDYLVPAGYYDGNTQIWAMDGNLNSSNILAGRTIFNVTGAATSDATATSAQIVNGYTAYINGNKVTGTIPNWSNGGRPAATGLWTGGGTGIYLQLSQGYTNGNDTWVYANEPNLVPANIISGKTICGVTGTGPSHGTQTWNTPGTYQWTVPDGITFLLVQVRGGGGGGGGGYDTSDYYLYGGGGGGGGGANITTLTVTPGQVLTVVVGAGGTGGINGSYHPSNTWPTLGGNGGDSSIASVVGHGGGGGDKAPNGGGNGTGGAGGAGGGFGSYGTSGNLGRAGSNGSGGSPNGGDGGIYYTNGSNGGSGQVVVQY